MKLFVNSIFSLLWLVFVLDVTKAQTCTNTTVVDCCLCITEQCNDTCPEGLYIQGGQDPTQGDLDCSSVLTTSTTPSVSTPAVSTSTEGITSTSTTPVRPKLKRQNFTLCVTKCPLGFYGNNNTGLCEPCPEQCIECTLNDTCIKCAPGFENFSGTCSISNETTMTTPVPKNNVAVIAGAVGGGAGVAVIIIIVVVVLVRCRRNCTSSLPRKSFTDKSEAIQNRNPGTEYKDDGDEEGTRDIEAGEGKPDHHIYANTAQINRQMTQHIHEGHDKVLRYTPDPTKSSLLKSTTANDDIALAQLPVAPSPPVASGRTASTSAARKHKSNRPTKTKKPEPITDDVYEPVGEGLPASKDPADSDSEPGENYENKQVIEQFKKSLKVSSKPSPEEQTEEDYENDEVVGQLKAGSAPEQAKADVPTPEAVNPTRKAVNSTRKAVNSIQKADNPTRKADNPTPEAADDPEHALEEYENEAVFENLRVPTKDPLDEGIYQNHEVVSKALSNKPISY